MKFLVRAFILLLVLNAALFFIHYKDSSIATAKSEKEQSYNQEIEVIHRANELIVRQHFTDLSSKRLEINWPNASEKRTCHVEDEESCVRLNEEATAFIEGEESRQSISYVIPIKEQTAEENYFPSVFATIHEQSPRATVLHVIDEVTEEGMWLTGLPQVGNQKLNLVNYALFSGRGPVTDLYWQQQQLPRESNDYVTVYGKDALALIEPYETLFTKLKAGHSMIVMNDANRKDIVSDRFMITSEGKLHDTIQEFAVKQFRMHYALSSLDSFTTEVLTALLLGEAVDLSLARDAVKELEGSLTAGEMTSFVQKVENIEEKIESAEEVDALLQEVTNYQTSFFSKNSEREESLYPFLLESPKEIVLGDDQVLEQHAIMQDGNTYYPIMEIMEGFGYDLSRNDHSLYIESMEREYRFPFENKFYVLNDRRFNMQAIPFKLINDEVYFEEAAMLRIFQLNLKNHEDEVKLTPITG